MAEKNDTRDVWRRINDFWIEAVDAVSDKTSLKIGVGGGILGFILGLATGPFGYGIATFYAFGGSGILVYISRVLYDIAYLDDGELAAQQRRHTLEDLSRDLDALEEKLAEVYQQRSYRRNPSYSIDRFRDRKDQIYDMYDLVDQITQLLAEEFSETVENMLLPEIRKLQSVAVRLFELRMMRLGQLFAYEIGGNDDIALLNKEIMERASDLAEEKPDTELYKALEQAWQGSKDQLEQFKAGLGNPDLLTTEIKKAEAGFDTARSKLRTWLYKLQNEQGV